MYNECYTNIITNGNNSGAKAHVFIGPGSNHVFENSNQKL